MVSLVVVLLLVASACGSTAKKTKSAINGSSPTTASAGPSGSATPGSSAAPGSHSSGSIGAPGGTTSSNSPTGAKPAGVTSKFLPAKGPGITNDSIYIGVGYSSSAAAGDKAIGAANAAPSYDERNVANAIINYTNKHGGYAGRTLKPLYYDINVSQDVSSQEQAACAYWTQDHKVFAIGAGNDILDTCAEKAGALPIGAGSATAATFKKYPHLIDPDAIAFDRLGAVTTAGLNHAHYFAGKLGLVTWDDPSYRAALQNGYLPALSKIGVKPLQIAYINVPQQLGAIGDMTAAVSAAVAKFKSLGIDHVIIQDGPAGVWSGDGLTFEWETSAKGQAYYPRYGGNDNNAPGFSVNPHDEENMGLFVEYADNDPSDDTGWHPNTARTQCFKIEADAGFPVSSANTNDEGIAAALCDAFFFTQRVMNSSTELSNNGFIAAAEKLGKSFQPATVYGSYLFPGRRDGGDMVRTAEYLNSCKCLKYQGPPAYAD
jgi:hypothetical protein